MEEHERVSRAMRKVEAMTGFYLHLAAFVVINVLLFIVDAMTGAEWWVQWPILGWGIGVAAHALAVFGRWPNFITKWQLRKVRELKDGR